MWLTQLSTLEMSRSKQTIFFQLPSETSSPWFTLYLSSCFLLSCLVFKDWRGPWLSHWASCLLYIHSFLGNFLYLCDIKHDLWDNGSWTCLSCPDLQIQTQHSFAYKVSLLVDLKGITDLTFSQGFLTSHFPTKYKNNTFFAVNLLPIGNLHLYSFSCLSQCPQSFIDLLFDNGPSWRANTVCHLHTGRS